MKNVIRKARARRKTTGIEDRLRERERERERTKRNI